MENFIDYLNTLHRCNGNNKNATAEANLQTHFSKEILVEDITIIDEIIKGLYSNDGKVLLTGFAGDGKTTLAQLVVEKVAFGSIITAPIQIFGETTLSKPLVVVKDLSESGSLEEKRKISEYLADPYYAVLLVSNTGTVLDCLKSFATKYGLSEIETESAVLQGIGGDTISGIGLIKLPNISISVINLVRHDNLKIARQVFQKIIDNAFWRVADEYKTAYPDIFANIEALQNSLVMDRLFLMYQRLYEYGERLTLRNLLEHFSFIITGNNNGTNTEMCFFDNVFGGLEEEANDITAIALIKKHNFGENIPSSWKRKIWINPNSASSIQILGPFQELFYKLLQYGKNKNEKGSSARLRLYRMLYFLSPLANEDRETEKYICNFLNSPGLIIWKKLQERKSLDSKLESNIINRVRHVIKEYFAGVKLPENEKEGYEDIYITMSRHSQYIRQSAQAVIASFKWRWQTTVAMAVETDYRGNEQLVLLKACKGKTLQECSDGEDCLKLLLPLPFLDYLLKRHMGHVGHMEFQNYQKRLDAFKIAILNDERKGLNYAEDDSILLVRLNSRRLLKDIRFQLVEEQKTTYLEVL
nr:hypothetical protein [uncultured Sphaerochaeta sp.]